MPNTINPNPPGFDFLDPDTRCMRIACALDALATMLSSGAETITADDNFFFGLGAILELLANQGFILSDDTYRMQRKGADHE